MTFTVKIHSEDQTLWATVEEYPGCFATGDTMDELIESLGEALSMAMTPEEFGAAARLSSMEPVAPHHVEKRTLEFC